MEVINIDLKDKKLSDFGSILEECQVIINENLIVNGGTLKKADIFEKDYEWTNLIIVKDAGKIVGFTLVKKSENKHSVNDTPSYLYISDIVVKNNHKRKGVGTLLMSKIEEIRGDVPVVASALKTNEASIALLSKFMTCYGESPKHQYYRFIDNKTYSKVYGDKTPYNKAR